MSTERVSTSGEAITNCVDPIILGQSQRTIKTTENVKMAKNAHCYQSISSGIKYRQTYMRVQKLILKTIIYINLKTE